MKIKAKMVGKTPIDLSTWELESVSEFETIVGEAIKNAASEALQYASSYEMDAWFPIEWAFGDEPSDGIGGPPPDDPLTVYVQLPLGAFDHDGPRWAFSLGTLVQEAIDSSVSTDKKIGEELRESMMKLRDGFLRLVQNIDEAL